MSSTRLRLHVGMARGKERMGAERDGDGAEEERDGRLQAGGDVLDTESA